MSDEREEIRLSPGERLIALMLCDIMISQKVKSDFDPQLIQSALTGGHDWALGWEYAGAFPVTTDDPRIREETVDILAMWSHIQDVRDDLKSEELARLKQVEDETTGEAVFPGFDANNDPHYYIASFLIRDMDRYGRYKDGNLNSHSQGSLPMHKRMLDKYKVFLQEISHTGARLSVDHLIEILKERVHPSSRGR